MTYGYNVTPSPTMTPGLPLNAPIVFFDDFLTGSTGAAGAYGKFSTTADTGEWLVIDGEAGTPTLHPVVQDNADGGWVALATDDVNIGDDISMQLNGTSFTVARGRKLYWESRLKVSAITDSGIFGLAIADTTPFASAPASYIAFRLVAGSIQFTNNDGGSAPTFVDSGLTVTANTFLTLAFEWNGVDRVRFYVDGAHVGTKTSDIPIALVLSPMFGVQTTVALAAATLTIDYVLVVNDRAA